jgi:hypothetical protein
MKLGLCDHHAVCVWVSAPAPQHFFLNALTSLYETWYVYQGT